MQLINLPSGRDLKIISESVEVTRLGRYHLSGDRTPEHSMACYLWNAEICKEFYYPLHFAELICRNRMNQSLKLQIGAKWYENRTFQSILSSQFRGELLDVIDKEAQQQGGNLCADHIVSALTFGFWGHLATKRFERMIWRFGIQKTFKGASSEATRQDLYDLIESVRRWRNRIAHHRAIFDKAPERKYEDAMKLISWGCTTTAKWVVDNSKFTEVMTHKPTDASIPVA